MFCTTYLITSIIISNTYHHNIIQERLGLVNSVYSNLLGLELYALGNVFASFFIHGGGTKILLKLLTTKHEKY